MLTDLHPIADKNSVRQVIATVFLLEPVYEPQRFKEYFNNELKDYHKFEIIKANSLKFRLSKGLIEDSDKTAIENGFRMVHFENGKLSSFLRGENLKTSYSSAIYSYHSLNYQGWETFLKTFLKNFMVLADADSPFFNAISLNYLNEFDWKSDLDIPIKEVFVSEEYFSEKFWKSQNSAFLLNTEEAKETYKENEKLEVVVSKERKKIIINSQLAFEFTKPYKLKSFSENGNLEENFNSIHEKIKGTLGEIFSEEVQQKINLI